MVKADPEPLEDTVDTWTDEHARLVATAAPEVPDPDLAGAWAQVQAGMGTAPARRSRRLRIVLGAGAAVAAMSVSGVAAAGILSARTGKQADAEVSRLTGPGEQINVAGADYGAVIDEETTDIPFPSPSTRENARETQLADAERDRGTPSGTTTGGIRLAMARHAVCAWANEWAAATTSGDASRRAHAIEVLKQSRTWPAITDVDAEQEFTPRTMTVFDESGRTMKQDYVDNTPFAWLPLVVEAAHGEDLAAMGRPFVEYTSCPESLVPDLPQAIHPELRGRG